MRRSTLPAAFQAVPGHGQDAHDTGRNLRIVLLSQPNLAGVRFARLPFLVEVGAGAAGQFIEVHLVGIEFRAIDAGELYFVTDSDAAAAAHSGSIHHYGIQAGERVDSPLASEG